jgi:alpha-tubulin suppressor-like RCC1 family protein
VLTDVCQQLDLRDLIRLVETCKRFRYGDGGLETVELPTKSPVVTALSELAFPRLELVPRTRPIGFSDSWVSYLARCARQRRCREAPPIAAGFVQTLFVDATGRLLACGTGVAVGHGDDNATTFAPAWVAAMAGIRVRSVTAGFRHSLALGWDGRVYLWGENGYRQLGHGDERDRPSPVPVEGLEGVCSIAAGYQHSLAVTESGAVLIWGRYLLREEMDSDASEDLENNEETENLLLPTIVEGFGAVRVRRVLAGGSAAFAISEEGELFAWMGGRYGLLGHGDT